MPLDIFHLILAALAYLIWGGFMATLLGVILIFLGRKRYILKGLFYGFTIWIAVRNFLVTLAVPEGLPPVDAATAAVFLASHLIWGALCSLIIVKYAPIEKYAFVILKKMVKYRDSLFYLHRLLSLFPKEKNTTE